MGLVAPQRHILIYTYIYGFKDTSFRSTVVIVSLFLRKGQKYHKYKYDTRDLFVLKKHLKPSVRTSSEMGLRIPSESISERHSDMEDTHIFDLESFISSCWQNS